VTKAAKTAGFAYRFTPRIEEFVHHTVDPEVEPPRQPDTYEELKDLGVTERRLTTGDGKKIKIWERDAAPGMPHVVLFHGRSGHWGDGGPISPVDRSALNNQGDHNHLGVAESTALEEEAKKQAGRDRHSRLKLLKAYADTGAGFTAVFLHGYGGSEGKPGETGFRHDVEAVLATLSEKKIPGRKVIIDGESLGTYSAALTAVEMTKSGNPPRVLNLTNPFYSFPPVAAKFVNCYPEVKDSGIRISSDLLDRLLKDDRFYIFRLIGQLGKHTHVHITTSGKDQVIETADSYRLLEILRNKSKEEAPTVTHRVFREADHYSVPHERAVRNVLRRYAIACRQDPEPSGNLGPGRFLKSGDPAPGSADHAL
jgi:hypothetical protein